MRLNILHTNDIHSNFDNFSKIVTKINELRDDNTIVLDAGDFADFKRIELQGTDGLVAMELLEYAGYDALAVGNNETFQGLDILKHMSENTKIPLLSCNMSSTEYAPIGQVKSSAVLHKNGLKILVIGASPNLGEFNELMGFAHRDYLDTIENEIKTNKDNCDLCIFLSHLGMDKDKEIAEKVNGIDIIIGGHFHILMEKPELVNNKIIFTSGAYGEHLGVLSIEVNDQKFELIEGNNISIGLCEESKEVLEIVRRNRIKAIDNLSIPLYKIKRDLWHDVVEENPMTNLLADGLRDVLKCDIGLINSGVINGGIKKGNVTWKKLIELCPSPLNPTSYKIQGKYLMEELSNSLDTDYCYADGKGAGSRGKYVGRLHVSNATIEHNGRTISNIYINGEALETDRFYTVASSDYLQRGSGYESLRNNVDVKYNKEYLRDTLKEYMDKSEFVERAFIDRWILEN
ncbi:MAG: bifunctional metallophosphatase/5-nucleotidase [Anaerocolumna sp.]|jgi:2',3'-cyclic-nucleotide 2'-phosphodiesterase (5'-nucleotidase family)|nr:bifunctional metallophosphatase/5-nucleotidase [Anaerocolumna sp.]